MTLKISSVQRHYSTQRDKGHLAIVQWLLENGANPLFENNDKLGGIDILQAAARSGNPDVLRLLLDDQRVDAGVALDHRLLDFGAESGKVGVLRLILGRNGFPMDGDA